MVADRRRVARNEARPADRPLRVLRIYHSGVVEGWRQRERELRARGVEICLASPRAWDEGGRRVSLEPCADDFVTAVRTLGRHPFLFLYDPRPLRRLLRTTAFDIIDVHEEPASAAAAELRLLRWLYGRRSRLLLYSAQNIPKRYPPPFRWFERRALREASAVYVCNRQAGDILRGKGFRGTVRLVGLGVDLERFSPSDAQSPGRGRLRVGYVGRLEQHKGVHVLLEAVAPLSTVSLEVVGDGPYRSELERRAHALGLAGRVRFSAFARHGSLPGVYQGLDVLAVPSVPTRTWVEQFCRVAVEAMACAVPIVASRTGSLPAVIGDAGVLVAPGDASALGAALSGLAADPVRRADLSQRARARAKRFSWASIAGAHHQLYREVMA
jgi:glycosyltransferase involved in cell wall biosynthesis